MLFLDEPTLGLDPDVSIRIRAQIARLRREQGTTIILTTHYMREAEELCDEIAFIKGGRILARGAADALKRQIRIGDVVALRLDPAEPVGLAELPGVLEVRRRGDRLECTVDAVRSGCPSCCAGCTGRAWRYGIAACARPIARGAGAAARAAASPPCPPSLHRVGAPPHRQHAGQLGEPGRLRGIEAEAHHLPDPDLALQRVGRPAGPGCDRP